MSNEQTLDFFDSLKDIKNKLINEEKTKEVKAKKPNEDEISKIFMEKTTETSQDKENRLKNEFLEFIKHSDVRKID